MSFGNFDSGYLNLSRLEIRGPFNWQVSSKLIAWLLYLKLWIGAFPLHLGKIYGGRSLWKLRPALMQEPASEGLRLRVNMESCSWLYFVPVSTLMMNGGQWNLRPNVSLLSLLSRGSIPRGMEHLLSQRKIWEVKIRWWYNMGLNEDD